MLLCHKRSKLSKAITFNGKIYLIGGRNASDQTINQVLCFDPSTNQWSAKANPMPNARRWSEIVWFEDRIWAIGGNKLMEVQVIKLKATTPISDSWRKLKYH